MPDLDDLTDEQRSRLFREFSYSREMWGPRAKFARQLDVDPSTVAILEGKRKGPLSEAMINRLTVQAGWPRDAWLKMATGQWLGPLDANQPDVDHRRPLRDIPTPELEKELALRRGELELPELGSQHEDEPA